MRLLVGVESISHVVLFGSSTEGAGNHVGGQFELVTVVSLELYGVRYYLAFLGCYRDETSLRRSESIVGDAARIGRIYGVFHFSCFHLQTNLVEGGSRQGDALASLCKCGGSFEFKRRQYGVGVVEHTELPEAVAPGSTAVYAGVLDVACRLGSVEL